jgi:hypothetical protein
MRALAMIRQHLDNPAGGDVTMIASVDHLF